jgi:heptosyltransferase-1
MPIDDFRLLIVKTSSLGDVIHSLPVLSDLARARPQVHVDWLVEEGYAALLRMSPHLDRVLEVAQRRWRAAPAAQRRLERAAFKKELDTRAYDRVIDLQGLLKSAVLAREARLAPGGSLSGLSFRSVREPLARLFYHHAYSIDPRSHAVERLRSLVGQVFGYQPEGPPRFELMVPAASFEWLPAGPYAVFLHASARAEKRWPAASFRRLAAHLSDRFQVVLPHGNAAEEAAATHIASGVSNAILAPRMGLERLAALLAGARLVVGVDTGLTHLASALDTPTVGLFGATPRWRYAPYWTPQTKSLGDGAQPEFDAVALAADQLLAGESVHA